MGSQVKTATLSSLRTWYYRDFGTSDGSVHLKLGRNVVSFINSVQENRQPLQRWMSQRQTNVESSMTFHTGSQLKLCIVSCRIDLGMQVISHGISMCLCSN